MEGMSEKSIRQTSRDNREKAQLVPYLEGYRQKALAAKRDFNAFIEVINAGALDNRVEQLTASKPADSQLFGIPLAVKDNICWSGAPTTCASRLLEGYRPTYTATVLQRLEDAGAVVIGKTNLDEFAFGSSNETSAYGAVLNPHATGRVPGGSSGGSAVAVAVGAAPLALGSDTGGSVRQPAAFCGVYGLKPTYGRLSRHGLVAFASSMDQIGLFARRADDLRPALEVCAGPDTADATSAAPPAEPPTAFSAGRIGVIREFRRLEGLQPAVERGLEGLLEALRKLGCEVVEVSLPTIVHSTAVYMLTAIAEASANLARFDGINYGVRRAEHPADVVSGPEADRLQRSYAATRGLGFGDEVKRRIMLGTFSLAEGYYDAYYLRAQKVRTLIRREFERAFADVELIVCPTTPTTAFRMGEKTADPLAMYLADMFTNPANLAGIPALSLPWGADDAGLPIGMQLLGPRFAEERILGAAEALGRR
jgi:aspartyl-tRNA(Asn)/glutamyl-tRNA(Gln) amidotransferase subunit A